MTNRINDSEDNLFIEKSTELQYKIKEDRKTYEKIKVFNQQKISIDIICQSISRQKDLESLLDLEILLLKEDSFKNWNEHFKIFCEKHSELNYLILMNGNDLFIKNDIDDGSLIFKLPLNDLFLMVTFKTSEMMAHAQCLELVVTMILRTIQIQDQQLIKNDGEVDFWEKVFAKIPYPMAVISSLGDLLIYNESFSKIGILPKECLRFNDQESLEIFKIFYKVRKIKFTIELMNVDFFIFYTSEKRKSIDEANNVGTLDSMKNSIGELGIISSSIAHELNNPLAGILAALSLLSLDEGWSEEEKSDLLEMKNCAKRCKELIEIFLGFSRFSPSSAKVPSIKDSIDQGINLLRFRMIESNLRLEIKHSLSLEKFSYQINASIMSMIFYLIFNELMTAFAHERLITQLKTTTIRGDVLEFSNQISIKIDYDFEYEENIIQSKLIQHLLVFENLEINFFKKEIRLIYHH